MRHILNKKSPKVKAPSLANSPRIEPISLSRARCGEILKIVALRGDSVASVRLRELGFCESTEVRKVSDGSALICHLLGTRIAIGRDLGAHILVEPLARS